MHGDFHSDSLKHSDCPKENIFKFAVMNPCFAIIDRNTLSSSKLRELLLKVFPGMEVFTYDTVEGFIKDSNRHFIHFFVSDLLLLSHNEEFDPLKNTTTVLSTTDTTIIRSGYHILDVSTPEKDIISALKDIRENFRNGACYPDYAGQKDGGHNVLSSRERGSKTSGQRNDIQGNSQGTRYFPPHSHLPPEQYMFQVRHQINPTHDHPSPAPRTGQHR